MSGIMETLATVVRNVAVLVLMMLFLQLLLPEGKMERFVRMIMGLLIISAVLGPLLSAVSSLQPAFGLFPQGEYEDNTAQVIAEGQELADAYALDALNEYETATAKQIGAILSLLPQLNDIRTEVHAAESGVVESVQVSATLDTNISTRTESEAKIRSLLVDFFALPEEVLTIDLKEEDYGG